MIRPTAVLRWSLAAALLAALSGCASRPAPATPPDYTRPLPDGAPALLPVHTSQWPDMSSQWYEREELLPALRLSRDWFTRPSTKEAFPVEGISHRRAAESLQQFEAALLESSSAAAFTQRLQRDFELFRSAGWDGQGGGVLFTGYCTPIVNGSMTRDAQHTWPLYGLPDDLVKAADGAILGQRLPDGSLGKYPDRSAIEVGGLLRGTEVVWLADPLDA
ncbi:MAG: membrane-bound lytic murein transglycosylase A, partial [Pseudohongiellaceae bacterium]